MKIIMEYDTDGEDWVAVYHPEDALRAIGIADGRGWCPLRRWASRQIERGEVFYTQSLTFNLAFDAMIEASVEQASLLLVMPE